MNDVASRNMRAMVVTLNTSHLDMSPGLKQFALWNIPDTLVALNTSKPEMSALKRAARLKR